MKRIFCLLAFSCLFDHFTSAQDFSDSPWQNNSFSNVDEDSPWSRNDAVNQRERGTNNKSQSSSTTTITPTTTTGYTKPASEPGTSSVPVPIDGGVVVLLAAGALYGGKRLKQQKKPLQSE